MTLKSDAKFEEKLTCSLKYDMKNLAKFHHSIQKCQNWDFDEVFCPNQKIYEFKIYKGYMCHENEE